MRTSFIDDQEGKDYHLRLRRRSYFFECKLEATQFEAVLVLRLCCCEHVNTIGCRSPTSAWPSEWTSLQLDFI